ncbi:hypothetical protein FRB90_009172, partial [Tulasnella sp. 427]
RTASDTTQQSFRPNPINTSQGRTQIFTENATDHRQGIAKEMNAEMLLCEEILNFLRYLPEVQVSDEDVEQAVQFLKEKHVLLTRSDKILRFAGFKRTPSKSDKRTEKERFKPLVKIITEIGNFVKSKDRTPSCVLTQKCDNYNHTETVGGNFKIDAYLKLARSTVPEASDVPRPLADAAVPCEFKSFLKLRFQNRKQLLGHISFTMTDDPRRMHMYGITIEDSTMAVWYFSRGYSVKSPDFDFRQDYRLFIRIMLIFLLANKEKLGYDPTVKRRTDSDGKPCFIYQVDNRYFKTVRSIFESRRLCVTGRGTRVWQVVEVRSFENLEPIKGRSEMVLKDVWLNKGAMTEGQNLRAIFDELEKLSLVLQSGTELAILSEFDQEERQRLRDCLLQRTWGRYFLTKECDWQGYSSTGRGDGAEPNNQLFDAPPSDPIPASSSLTSETRHSTPRPTDPADRRLPQRPRSYGSKQQYRIVYQEICTPMHEVRPLSHVFTALEDCVFALQLMFLAGWVHRDISSGNVYLYTDKERQDQIRGILGDLEYAKRFSDTRCSLDPKTGTAYFMAVEIQTQQLIGTTISPENQKAKPTKKDMEDRVKMKQAVDNAAKTVTGVRHHFQHDMESVFWLLLWILLRRFPRDPKPAGLDDAILDVFQDTSTCPLTRAEIIKHDNFLENYLNCWLDDIHLRDLIPYLASFRDLLKNAYDERPKKMEDLADYANLYSLLCWMLGKCRDLMVKQPDLPLLLSWRSSPSPQPVNTPSPANPAVQVHERSKRKRASDGDKLPKNARSKVDHPTASRSDLQDGAIQCAKPDDPPSEESGSSSDDEDEENNTRLGSEESDPEESDSEESDESDDDEYVPEQDLQ